MAMRASYIPEHQFHMLIKVRGEERSVAVLPDDFGSFLVVDQGRELARMQFNPKRHCLVCEGKLDAEAFRQLANTIKDHYTLPYALS